MVYARRAGDRTLSFIVSGMLWRNSLVMMDEQTSTLWSHVTGKSLGKTAQPKPLEVLPAVQTTWARWKAAHPETTVLRKEKNFDQSAYEDYMRDPTRFGLGRAKHVVKRLPGKALVHGLALDGRAVAVLDARIGPAEPVLVRLGESPVVFARGPDGGVRAHLAVVDGRSLALRWDAKRRRLVDRTTGSVWDPGRGTLVGGKMDGRSLEELPVTAAFWFAWSSFYPSSQVVD